VPASCRSKKNEHETAKGEDAVAASPLSSLFSPSANTSKSTSKTATIVPSPTPQGGEEVAADSVNLLVVSSSTQATRPLPGQRESPPEPLSLNRHTPTTEQVLKRAQEDELLIELFKDSFWPDTEEQKLFYNNTIWEEVALKIECAIKKYTPKLEKDMKEKALRFEKKMRKIQDMYVCK